MLVIKYKRVDENIENLRRVVSLKRSTRIRVESQSSPNRPPGTGQ